LIVGFGFGFVLRTFVKFRITLFSAIGTNTMGKPGIRAFVKIGFKLFPVLFIITDFFAETADGNEPF